MESRTPKSRVRGWLRQMFVRSNERNYALSRDNYSCQICGVKKSVRRGAEQKIEVHHKEGINVWEELINIIYDKLLCDPDKLQTLCPECHRDID